METISSEKIMSTLREELAQINATVDRQEASVVTEVADGIARISGLKTAMAGELLKLTSSATGLDVYGLVQNLDQDDVGAVLFGDVEDGGRIYGETPREDRGVRRVRARDGARTRI